MAKKKKHTANRELPLQAASRSEHFASPISSVKASLTAVSEANVKPVKSSAKDEKQIIVNNYYVNNYVAMMTSPASHGGLGPPPSPQPTHK